MKSHRHSSRGRGPREPRYWSRLTQTLAPTFGGAAVAGTLFDPTTFTTGATDSRITVLGIRLAINYSFTQVAASSVATVAAGVYMDNSGQLRDPSIAAATDQRADWMDLWAAAAAGPTTAAATYLCMAEDTPIHRIIRAKRKIDQEEAILFSVKVAGTGATASVVVVSSVLWQRTLR